ncbi:hypothetical protein AB751O23_AF_00080 [Chlamydiales bacterium SCGC AB-751-O23]|nr:hypothetical protein AB751O23_AF_00080 [Chlamydiales bacterium SCGC AB-751-O23]
MSSLSKVACYETRQGEFKKLEKKKFFFGWASRSSTEPTLSERINSLFSYITLPRLDIGRVADFSFGRDQSETIIPLLFKDVFSSYSYNLGGYKLKVTSCYDTLFALASCFSSEDHVRTLRNRFSHSETSSIFADLEGNCIELFLNDFFMNYSFSKKALLTSEESHSLSNNTSLDLEEISRTRKLKSLVSFSDLACFKEKILNEMKTIQIKILDNLERNTCKNAFLLSRQKSFIYYVLLHDSEFHRRGQVHLFSIEQYLNEEGTESYRLYNSYQDNYTLSDWLGAKVNFQLNKGEFQEFILFLREMFSATKWNSSLNNNWHRFFRVDYFTPEAILGEDGEYHVPLIRWGREPCYDRNLYALTIQYAFDSFSPQELIRKLQGKKKRA